MGGGCWGCSKAQLPGSGQEPNTDSIFLGSQLS